MPTAMLGPAVASPNHPETGAPALQASDARPVADTQDAPCAPVGAPLPWPLEQGLGADFTPEVREARTETHALAARAILQADAA
ncbi:MULTISPECIES: globin family protein [Methylobacterium]|uniref:Uncharacterized protein n=1 Tax=Methylobacterium fujisawaense TaxID=107400 RepID=A0ABR6DAV8_9HYPH|nr:MULTISPECIES: hypothetical protein [Methylobacterium]MBA9063223.1 hypothetical protein [Methylobacterium fujisawaense]